MKLKALGLGLLLVLCLSYCATTGAQEAKMYRTNLETMLGKDRQEVTAMISQRSFRVLDSWQAENPDADMVRQHNRRSIGFSTTEIQSIFAPGGKYEVLIFSRKIGTDSATTGEIDEFGRGVLKDAEYTSEVFAVIRTVFRDGRLASHKVWPNMTSTSISGGLQRIK
jgi:hypothetical protein